MSESNKTEKIKVALVDDDAFLLDMYANHFVAADYDISVFLGAEKVLNKLRDGYQPDILVFDMLMPGIDGLDFFESVNSEKLSPDSINIALTNQGDSEDLKKAEKLGLDGYILKVLFTPSQVVEKVTNIYNSK